MNVVLLPGMDGTGTLYDGLVEALPAELTPIIVRYPRDRALGYDALLGQILDEIPDTPHLVLAESFSGPLAVRYAARRPPALRGLVLCATFLRSPAPAALTTLGATLLRLGPPAPPTPAVRALLTGRDAPEDLVDAVRDAITSVDRRVLAARLRAIGRVDVRTAFAEVDVPTTVIRATRDRLVRPRATQELTRIRPSVTVVEVDAPHLVVQRRPGVVAATLSVT